MQSLNEIRQHLSSIRQTKQITNAMYLLSTSRMKKAMTHIDYNKKYLERVRATMKDILLKSYGIRHPYLDPEETEKHSAYIVIAADKGLAGAYNSNVLNLAWEHLKDHPKHYVCTAGIMATNFFVKKGVTPDLELLGLVQDPKLGFARSMAESMLELYDQKIMNEVFIVYTHFINSAQQYPRIIRLLPLKNEDFIDVDVEYPFSGDILYDPSPEVVFQNLVPQYILGVVYEALVMSFASEHCARMNAMQSSSKNADEMIAKLQAQYNGARQFAITREINEIVAGSARLEV